MSSPTQIAWSKFIRNIPAVVGLGYLIMCCIVAVLAYILAPDHSRNANFQVIEFAKMAPGTRAEIVLLPLPGDIPDQQTWGGLTGYAPAGRPLALKQGAPMKLENGFVFVELATGASDSLKVAALDPEGRIQNISDFRKEFVRELHFVLGTDAYGRDLLSRIILGTRISLVIGLMAVLISLFIGILLGTFAGYFGGWVDRIIMWLVSVVWSVPTLLLALAISLALGKGFWQVFLAIGLSMWVEVARIVRGQIVGIRKHQFAEAAQALGFGHARIMFRHVLPNVISPIIVIAVANFGAAVLIESGLSFLGIGVEVPIPTWGRMIYEGYTYIVFENGKWLALFPGIALIGLVISINLIGIGLRDALDVNI